MLKILNFIAHFIRMATAEGKKRIGYAFLNLLYIAISFAAVFLIVKLYNGRLSDTISTESCGVYFGSWLGIIVCAIIGLEFFLLGVVSQAILLVCALIGIIISSTRIGNLVAFLISLASIGALAAGVYFFLIV